MNDRTPCATPEALVTYLYEECDPVERQSLAAHVATCSSCAAEIEALSDTRAHLASWSPPAMPLGFQITRSESDQPAKVLRPAAWWKSPLPAWAQAAAAVVIFAGGMSVNAFRSPVEQPARVAETQTTQPVALAADTRSDDLSVTREEFARLEARLRAMERADVSRASYTPPADDSLDSDDVRTQLSSLKNRVAVNESWSLDRFKEVQRALEANQKAIDVSRENAQKITLMDEELQGHRQVLLNPALLYRTALTSSGR